MMGETAIWKISPFVFLFPLLLTAICVIIAVSLIRY